MENPEAYTFSFQYELVFWERVEENWEKLGQNSKLIFEDIFLLEMVVIIPL